VGFALRGPWQELEAALVAPGLGVRASLLGGQVDELRLEGAGRTFGPVRWTPGDEPLAWNAVSGWRGSLDVTSSVTREGLTQASASLVGVQDAVQATGLLTGNLANAEGGLRADVRLVGTPWSPSWDGTAEANLRVDARNAEAEAFTLTLPITLQGEGLLPAISGEGRSAGALDVVVALERVNDALLATATGPGVDATLTASLAGWQADAEIGDVPLGAWVPELGSPNLTGRASLQGGDGLGVRGTIDGVTLTSERVTFRGGGTVADGVRLDGDTSVDLARATGGTVRGTLAGPVSLMLSTSGGAMIDALWQTSDVGIGGTAIQATTTLEGALTRPSFTLDASLEGDVAGDVSLKRDLEREIWRLNAVAAGRAAGSEVAIDLAASMEGGVSVASGSLRVDETTWTPDATATTFRLSSEQADGVARLSLEALDRAVPTLSAHLPLRILDARGEGWLDASLQAPGEAQGATWLTGTLRDPGVGGVRLPTLTLTGSGSELALGTLVDGTLDARLDLSQGAWRARAFDLPVTAFAFEPLAWTVNAEGTGFEGSLQGSVRNAQSDVTFDARWEGAVLRASAEGTLLDGELNTAVARRDGQWSGDLRLTGTSTPFGIAALAASVEGTSPWPDLTVVGNIEGIVPVDVQVAVEGGVRPGSVSLRAASRATAEHAVVQGEVWPAIDLTILGEEGQATLRAAHWSGPEPWLLDGAARFRPPGLQVDVTPGPMGAPRVRAALASDDATSLQATLPAQPPIEAIRQVQRDGLTLETAGSLTGEAWIDPRGAVEVRNLTWTTSLGTTGLNGVAAPSNVALEGSITPDAADDATLAARLLRNASGVAGATFQVSGDVERIDVALSPADGAQGSLTGSARWTRDGTVTIDAAATGTELRAQAVPGEGIGGRWTFDRLTVDLPGGLEATLDGLVAANESLVDVDLLARGPGRATLSGSGSLAPFLPSPYRGAEGEVDGEASLRLAGFDVQGIPFVARAVPHLEGTVSALAEVRGTRLIAQVEAPNLVIAGRQMPLRLDGAGDVAAVDGGVTFGGSWAGSVVQGSLDLDAATVLLAMERFPVSAPLEAFTGPLESEAEATGVLRADYAWRDATRRGVRFATEAVTLRAGETSLSGTINAVADSGRVQLDAALSGAGAWRADASIDEAGVDVAITVSDGDASPILGLVPAWRGLDLGARGDVTLTASGTLERPFVALREADVDLSIAGASYRVRDAEATLDDGSLRIDAHLAGTRPVGGDLAIAGSAEVRLMPWRFEEALLTLEGTIQLPLVGAVEQARGRIDVDPSGAPRLQLDGVMGSPVRFDGTLWPLDVTATGDDVTLTAPAVFVASATGDVDLRLRFDEAFVLSGAFAAREGRLTTDRGVTPDVTQEGVVRSSRGQEQFRFEAIALTAERMTLDTSFAEGAVTVDLNLAGNALTPTLAGSVDVTRGSLTVSGREFQMQRGALTFEPTRGFYPRIRIEAVTTFEKRDVLAGAGVEASIPQPAGATFDVQLDVDAEATPTPGGTSGFVLDLDPVLSSDAVLSVPASDTRGAIERPLTDAELTSLVTLRRLDVGSDVLGGNLAASVATGALDSAIEGVLFGELQDAFATALGVDVLEIRTTPLSTVLRGEEEGFGVSLRLGGYVSDGLFASYEVGRYADSADVQALSNTFALRYQLGPVGFDLSTRLDIAEGGATPASRADATIRYDVTPAFGVEAGARVGSTESEARFGVTLRW